MTTATQLSPTELAEAKRKIAAAMRWLSARCLDFASVQNGIGFDKGDTMTGHEFAEVPPEEWDDEMTSWGYQRCRKYRKQLEGLQPGYFDGIPVVEKVEAGGEAWFKRRRREKKEAEKREEAERVAREKVERERPYGGIDGDEAEFYFPYNPDLIQVMKDMGGRWNGHVRCWVVKVTPRTAPKILALASDHNFRLSPELVAACKAQEGKSLPPERLIVQGAPGVVRYLYPYDPAMNEVVKALGARWDRDARCWAGPLGKQNAPGILGLAERHGFHISGDVIAAVTALAEEGKAQQTRMEENLRASEATTGHIAIPGFTGALYDFQRAGVEYMVREKRVLNADQPGLGKTRQAIGAVQHLGAYPAIVVCPSSVKYNWEIEWHNCAPGHTVKVISGTKPLPMREYQGVDVLILNYDILDGHAIQLKAAARPKALIVDESHYIKNEKAARTQNVTFLCEGIGVRYFLTGTPTLNKPVELLSQLVALGRLCDVMGEPVEKRARWQFLQRHCDAWSESIGRKTIWHTDGAADLDVLNRNMRRVCYIRRQKAEVLTSLPPKRRVVVPVEITNRAEYNRLEQEFLDTIAEEALKEEAFLKEIADLSPEEQTKRKLARREGVDQAKHIMRITALKKCVAKGKLKAIREWARDFLDSGQKLVMFGWHRETVEMLAEEFGAPTIMGGDSALSRQASVMRFQNDPAVKAIACNIVAAGEGITLTAASDTLFAELGWNPGKHEQAEDRTHRIGQTAESVTSWYLIGKDTIEEKLYRLIFDEKARVTRAANDGTVEDDDRTGGTVFQMLMSELLEAVR